MPGTPEVTTSPVQTTWGQIPTTMAVIDNGPIGFIVSHNDYPESELAQRSANSILDAVRDGQVGKENKLISEQRLTMNKYLARRILIQEGDQIIVSQIVLAGQRLYQAIYVGPPGTENGADAKRFIDSFAIVAR